MKDYRYNFGFLAQWMAENTMNKKDVLDALQTRDYNGLNDWIAGERPMHIEAILRLCNTYDIPLGCFFFDKNARPDIQPPLPGDGAKMEPTTASDKKRGRGPKKEPIHPEPMFRKESLIPVVKVTTEQVNVAAAPVTDDVKALQIQLEYERKISNLKDLYQERVENLRRDYEQRLNSRDELVMSQQEEINHLREEIRKAGGYRRYEMVADQAESRDKKF